MNKRLYLISDCKNKIGTYYQFPFRGYYKGIKITKVLVQGDDLSVGNQYVLALDHVYTKGNSLITRLVKAKQLFL